MKLTIYVPDDLGARLQEHNDINVSALAQRGIRDALDRRSRLVEMKDADAAAFARHVKRQRDRALGGLHYVWELLSSLSVEEQGELRAHFDQGEDEPRGTELVMIAADVKAQLDQLTDWPRHEHHRPDMDLPRWLIPANDTDDDAAGTSRPLPPVATDEEGT